MSFFKHVQLHKYDLTDKGVSQACKDEIIADMGDAVVHLTDEQLNVLADHMREQFKDYMRPLFALGGSHGYGVVQRHSVHRVYVGA